jgi:hypothetical protein
VATHFNDFPFLDAHELADGLV